MDAPSSPGEPRGKRTSTAPRLPLSPVGCIKPNAGNRFARLGTDERRGIMAIVNRRNAVLGWTVWKVGKHAAKKKAKDAVPGPGTHVGLNKSAIASILAAIGGALFFWQHKKSSVSPQG
jgi:hypothetical protein